MPLDADFFARHSSPETFFNFRLCGQILTDCDSNVFQRFFTRRALAVAAREVITPNREPLLGLDQRHVIIHRLKKCSTWKISSRGFSFFCSAFLSQASSFCLINSKRG